MPDHSQETLTFEVPNTAGFDGIHPTAIIGNNARIGDGVSIGPYAIVEDDTEIRDGAQIGPHAFIGRGSVIGRNCRLFHGVIVGTEPQDLKFRYISTTVEIGDETVLREYCTIHRGTEHRKKTIIGRKCFLMAYCHFGHDCIVGDNVIMANGVNLGGHVEIGNNANLGAMVGFHQFVKVGEHAFIAGGFRVVKDVPPYIMGGGDPVAFHGLNTVGLSRKGISKEIIRELKQAYHVIYRSGLNVSQALKKIKGELELTPEINKIITFIENSERGIIPSGSRG